MRLANRLRSGHGQGRAALFCPRSRGTLSLLVAVLVSGVVVAGCGSTSSTGSKSTSTSAAADSATAKSTLRIGLPYSYFQYYPNLAEITTSGNSGALELSLAYSSLFHMLPSGQTEGELATSGNYVPTGHGPDTGFEFTLRHGVRFSDGTPLNAAAVVGWMKFYAKQIGGDQALFGPHPAFTALGDWKVRMTVSVPVANMSRVLSDVGDYWGTIASPACVAKPKLFVNGTCGTGPYMLDTAKTVPNTTYAYVPNPYYYDKPAVKYSGVVVSVIPQPSAALAALQSGQLGFAYVGAESSTVSAAKAAGLQVDATPVGAYQLLLNEKGPSGAALRKASVRQAISYAIDRPALAQLVARGYSTASDLFPVTDVPDPSSTTFSYDPAKAKALLAQAGYSNGLTLKVALVEARTQDQTMFGGVAQELKAVGINLKPVNFTAPSSIFDNDGYLLTTIGNTTQVQYNAWMAAGNPLASWPTDAHLVSLYHKGSDSQDPTSDWMSLLQYESDQSYYVTICTVSGIWYVTKSVTGVDVTAPRIGAVLINELSPTT